MVHFIGIKGSGMASLATILYDLGYEVQGSDIEKYIFTQKGLEERNIRITSFDACNIQPGMEVIIGNAFDDSNPEVKQALSDPTVKTYRYHEYLGELIKKYTTICIAGTHGKTTTTGMMANMMQAIKPCGYLIGDGTGEMSQDSHFFALESCEYMRHFLAYKPEYAIITNIDLDHVDYYKDLDDYKNAFETFANQVKKKVIICGDDENLLSLDIKTDVITYGLNENNDVRAINFVENEEGMKFDVLIHNQHFGHFEFEYVGTHLLLNSLAVITMAYLENGDADLIQNTMKHFVGVKRRFNVEVNKDHVYIDDYAHHPTAIKVTLEAARLRYPDKKLVAVYKPDRYSRLVVFINEFIEALSIADEVCLVPFNENTLKEEGYDIDIHYIADRMPNALIVTEDEESAEKMLAFSPAVYVGMSTKDVYRILNNVKRYQKP